MENNHILNGNVEIAKMIGWKEHKGCLINPLGGNPMMLRFDELIFHSDWNWLMMGVMFIQKQFYFVNILGCGICEIKGIDGKTKNPHISFASDDIRFSTFESVSDFAKKYNNNEL